MIRKIVYGGRLYGYVAFEEKPLVIIFSRNRFYPSKKINPLEKRVVTTIAEGVVVSNNRFNQDELMRFAAETLMPRERLEEDKGKSVNELSELYQVPKSFVGYCLRRLEE